MQEHELVSPLPPASATPATSPSPSPATLSPAFPTVPGLFPRRSLNLLIGAPKTGRLCFILPQLNSYLAQHSFLGYQLDSRQAPEQPAMICCAKSYDTIWHKIRALNLDHLAAPRAFPIERWISAREQPADIAAPLDTLYDRLCRAARTPPKFLLIDGFQLLMTSRRPNDQHAVAEFLDHCQEFCDRRDCTILGIVGTAKLRAGEHYQLLPHRVMGSTQWSEGVSSLIGLFQTEIEKPIAERSGLREIILAPQSGEQTSFYAAFDELGRLTPVDDTPGSGEANSALYEGLDSQLTATDPGRVLTKSDLRAWAQQENSSERTLQRWTRSRVELGLLLRSGEAARTRYRKPEVTVEMIH